MARRRHSQIFLSDARTISRLVAVVPPRENDAPVLEIGPGSGAVTRGLLAAGFRVVAVEVDDYWAEITAAIGGSIRVVHASILDTALPELVPTPATVVGSLPYHLSGAILRWLADNADYVGTAVLILQDEVVRRVGAEPGSRERGLLSIIMQSVYDVKPLFRISPGAFVPRPGVWSRSVMLTRSSDAKPVGRVRPMWRLAADLFRHRRKMIGGSLKRVYGPAARDRAMASGLDLTRRPETLTLAELEALEFAVSSGR